MVIGIAGPTASGKTTVARMLEEKLGAVRLRYSSLLSEMARERGLDPDDKATLQGLYLTERETRGEDFLAKEMFERVRDLQAPYIVIEGNRRLVDIDGLRRIAKMRDEELVFLFIDASRETRFARYNERLISQGDDVISYQEFTALESNDAEDEVDAIRSIFEKEGIVIGTDTKEPADVFALVADILVKD